MFKFDLDRTVCQRTQVSNSEGWGGKPIEYFPPFGFFLSYHRGKHSSAERDFSEWYYEQFLKKEYALVPKRNGGMFDGSLFNEVARLDPAIRVQLAHGQLSELDVQLVWQAIRNRVHQRWQLYISIAEEGFIPARGNCISVASIDGKLEIQNGHHRLAILKILGYQSAPMLPLPATLDTLRKRLTG